jgi:predicted Zn finger-like uncharacterized protein
MSIGYLLPGPVKLCRAVSGRIKRMSDEHYVVMTVECPHCKTKQKVHVNARTGASQMVDQAVTCLRCANHFSVMLPDRIIRGPFPT